MRNARTYTAVGLALLCFGVAFFALGFLGGQPGFRMTGPVLAFVGLVLLAQARRLG
jgi:hypothetical protein